MALTNVQFGDLETFPDIPSVERYVANYDVANDLLTSDPAFFDGKQYIYGSNSTYPPSRPFALNIEGGASTEFVTGFWLTPGSYGSGQASSPWAYAIICLWTNDISYAQITVAVRSDLSLGVYRGVNATGSPSATLGTSGPGVVAYDTCQFIELYYKAGSSSDGAISVFVDGVEVINLTNITTLYSTATEINQFGSSVPGSSGKYTRIQSWYFGDATGKEDRLGPIDIKYLLPTADTADEDLNPSSGSDSYAMVDDVPANATDYLESQTSGDVSKFTIGSITLGANESIVAAKVMAQGVATALSLNAIKAILDSNGNEAKSSQQQLAFTDISTVEIVQQTNPDGDVAWTESAINAIKAGVEVV